ncbi:hypothetical protein [Parvibaculum sp.]
MAPRDPRLSSDENDAPRVSAFAAGLGPRLVVALAATAALWLGVFWALAR